MVQKGFLEQTKWCTRQTKWCAPLHKGIARTLLTGWELHNSLEPRPSWRWVWVWHYIRNYKALSFSVKTIPLSYHCDFIFVGVPDRNQNIILSLISSASPSLTCYSAELPLRAGLIRNVYTHEYLMHLWSAYESQPQWKLSAIEHQTQWCARNMQISISIWVCHISCFTVFPQEPIQLHHAPFGSTIILVVFKFGGLAPDRTYMSI